MSMRLIALVALIVQLAVARQEWDAASYPNPTSEGFRQCNMKSTASICDPDSVLTESERYRLNHELSQLEGRTRQENARTFCEKKGITGAIALAKNVRGASENAVRAMANDMLQKWSLDSQCQKSLVIVVATEDRKFWVARASKVPVYGAEFTDIFNSQKQLFADENYPQALTNILQATWDKALSKQGTPPGYGPDGSAGRGSSSGGKIPADQTPKKGFSIPMWVWLALLFVVIPTLCCCGCIYFCCIRKKNDGSASPVRRQGPTDIEGGGTAGARRGGGGMQGLLGGLSGGAIMSALNGLRNRGGGGGAPVPTPAARPTGPATDPNAGLYPKIAKEDQGGGGAW
jgi:hypothetical protein